MPINKYYMNFATSFSPFKPTKGIKRNQLYTHRFPQLNLEILTNVTSGYFIWHDAYAHTSGCVSTSQPQEPLNIGMYLDWGKKHT